MGTRAEHMPGRSDRESRFVRAFLSLNRQIKTLYNVNMNFLFDADESRYITFPAHVRERSEYLRTVVRAERPLIVDGFACVGGDSLVFMGDFMSADVYAVQRAVTDGEKDRYARLAHNISDFNAKCRLDVPKALAVPCAIEDFLPNVQETIDLLYLDPPWEITEGREYDESSIMEYISGIVAGAKVHVNVVVIKIRYDLSRTDCLPGYEFLKTIQVMQKARLLYCFHVFQNKTPYPLATHVVYRDPWGDPEEVARR